MAESKKLEIKIGPTNSDPGFLLDQARRICDLIGLFDAKRGQTNERYKNEQRIVLSLPNAHTATWVKDKIEECCHSAIKVRPIE